MCVCVCVYVCDGFALTGLLVLSDLQASGRFEGFSCAGGWTAEEAATRESHTRQATYLRPLYQLQQVHTTITVYCAAVQLSFFQHEFVAFQAKGIPFKR